jgi:hypothetical protein
LRRRIFCLKSVFFVLEKLAQESPLWLLVFAISHPASWQKKQQEMTPQSSFTGGPTAPNASASTVELLTPGKWLPDGQGCAAMAFLYIPVCRSSAESPPLNAVAAAGVKQRVTCPS